MNKPTYCVAPRLKKRLFRKPIIVYDVVQVQKVWRGLGINVKGEWVERYKRLITYKSLEEATSLVKALS
ncbi:hypothetical protein D3C81_441990 [compost metagenome]